jgi:hypothetical protein
VASNLLEYGLPYTAGDVQPAADLAQGDDRDRAVSNEVVTEAAGGARLQRN